MKAKWFFLVCLYIIGSATKQAHSQTVDSAAKLRKNVIRYNLTGALLFGFDKYIVLGYERVLSPRKSFSINFGTAAMPKLISVITDSFQTKNEGERKGLNVSVDYRFYLAKENKFNTPHGLYIGPYYSFNQFKNEKTWSHVNSGGSSEINTNSTFDIHTFGFELGYQFILWKHFALDMIMVGPGLGFYKYEATFSGNTNLTDAQKEQLREALKQTLTQKFPGMNFVFSDKKIDSDGVLQTKNIGYRYIVHIGYNF